MMEPAGETKKEMDDLDEGSQSDVELKRSFSFCSRGKKRPPELDIELITHPQSHDYHQSSSTFAVSSGNTEGPRTKEALCEPLNLPTLSPLSMPANYINLSGTPTMLSSFMNVLNKKESEPHPS